MSGVCCTLLCMSCMLHLVLCMGGLLDVFKTIFPGHLLGFNLGFQILQIIYVGQSPLLQSIMPDLLVLLFVSEEKSCLCLQCLCDCGLRIISFFDGLCSNCGSFRGVTDGCFGIRLHNITSFFLCNCTHNCGQFFFDCLTSSFFCSNLSGRRNNFLGSHSGILLCKRRSFCHSF